MILGAEVDHESRERRTVSVQWGTFSGVYGRLKMRGVNHLLRYQHLAQTLRATRRFEGQGVAPRSTPGQDQYRMRSAMDVDPRVGKWISRRSVQVTDPQAWKVAPADGSTFIDPGEIEDAAQGIRNDGFYVFQSIAPRSWVDSIRAYAEDVPCIARGAGASPARYPRTSPTVGRYDIEETTALGCPEVQDFVTDPALIAVAQRYLGQPVVQDEVAFWWTTTRRAEDANLNAQLFHQDRDRLSFLKFFIYLTDVTPETGPHVYLRGSHLSIPRSLRPDGRKSDEAVREAGLWHEVRELSGPAGTVMAVDTVGLHKGKTPIAGDRLALEFECATSLFGADYELPKFTPTSLTRQRFAVMPWVLQRYAGAIATAADDAA